MKNVLCDYGLQVNVKNSCFKQRNDEFLIDNGLLKRVELEIMMPASIFF